MGELKQITHFTDSQGTRDSSGRDQPSSWISRDPGSEQQQRSRRHSQAANLRPLRAPGKSSSSNLKRSKNKTIRRSCAFTQIETHPLITTVCQLSNSPGGHPKIRTLAPVSHPGVDRVLQAFLQWGPAPCWGWGRGAMSPGPRRRTPSSKTNETGSPLPFVRSPPQSLSLLGFLF